MEKYNIEIIRNSQVKQVNTRGMTSWGLDGICGHSRLRGGRGARGGRAGEGGALGAVADQVAIQTIFGYLHPMR